jgi:ABC-type transport system involved in cytochrome c biogenesis ATPase subunit
MGAQAYRMLPKFCTGLQGAIVEVGSERGEGSTTFLRELASVMNSPFYSVDIQAEPYRMTGEAFLTWMFPTYGQKICLAYLDNFDWTYDAIKNERWLHEQVAQYAELGIIMNNENSQAAHLQQAQLVAKYAADQCLILFDDTWPVLGAHWDGKGGSAALWLWNNGWKVISQSVPIYPGEETTNGYVLMGRGL